MTQESTKSIKILNVKNQSQSIKHLKAAEKSLRLPNCMHILAQIAFFTHLSIPSKKQLARRTCRRSHLRYQAWHQLRSKLRCKSSFYAYHGDGCFRTRLVVFHDFKWFDHIQVQWMVQNKTKFKLCIAFKPTSFMHNKTPSSPLPLLHQLLSNLKPFKHGKINQTCLKEVKEGQPYEINGLVFNFSAKKSWPLESYIYRRSPPCFRILLLILRMFCFTRSFYVVHHAVAFHTNSSKVHAILLLMIEILYQLIGSLMPYLLIHRVSHLSGGSGLQTSTGLPLQQGYRPSLPSPDRWWWPNLGAVTKHFDLQECAHTSGEERMPKQQFDFMISIQLFNSL